MNDQINTLIEAIKVDYLNWSFRPGPLKIALPEDLSEVKSTVRKKMISDFNDGLTYTVGNKYIKIVSGMSVWGFVVNTDKDKKFRMGDILMAANWATPARNKPRGNVIDGGYSINWTGPRYL